MRGVVRFNSLFTAITNRAVSQQEAQSAIGKVNLMVLANAIRDEGHAGAVVAAMPKRAVGAQASGESLIDLRVCKGLGLAVVPSKTPKRRKFVRETLLQVDAEAILAREMPRMVGDIRPGNETFQELGYRIAINSHVCVVRESQYTDHSRSPGDDSMAQFILEVFRMGLPGFPHQINSIGHLGHERLGETKTPIMVFVVRRRANCVPTRIGGVVIGAIVVDGPVGELKMSIRAHRILVEEIHHAEFSEPDLQAAAG